MQGTPENVSHFSFMLPLISLKQIKKPLDISSGIEKY